MKTSNVVPFKAASSSGKGAEAAPRPIRVISVGRDKQILRLRAKLLVHGGYSVRSVAPEEAETDARSPASCVWIFCSSVDLAQLVYLACSIRRFSQGSRLLLIEGSRPPKFEAALLLQRKR